MNPAIEKPGASVGVFMLAYPVPNRYLKVAYVLALLIPSSLPAHQVEKKDEPEAVEEVLVE